MNYHATVCLIYFYRWVYFPFKFLKLLTFRKRMKVACCTFIDRTVLKLVFRGGTLARNVRNIILFLPICLMRNKIG